MGMATGVVAATIEALRLAAEWVTPGAVKKAAAGHIQATKDEVQVAVFRRFEWTDGTIGRYEWQREHVADAAGAVLAASAGTLLRTLRVKRPA